MADALVAPDVHLALDVLQHVAAQIAFDFEVLIDEHTDATDFVVGGRGHACSDDVAGFTDLLRKSCGRAEDVSERVSTRFSRGMSTPEIRAMVVGSSALTLLVTGLSQIT